MLNSETVTYVPVTTVEDDLGNETPTDGTPVALTALVAIGDTREQFGDNAPDLTVGYTLYFLPGNLPAATAASYFVVRGERCEVSSGPNGRWGSMGEVVAVSRTGSRVAPDADPDDEFRTVAVGAEIAAEAGDPRLESVGAYVISEAGTSVFVIVSGLEDGPGYSMSGTLGNPADPEAPASLYALLLVTANDESTVPLSSIPVGSYLPAAMTMEPYTASEAAGLQASYAAIGVDTENLGVGVHFFDNDATGSVVEA